MSYRIVMNKLRRVEAWEWGGILGEEALTGEHMLPCPPPPTRPRQDRLLTFCGNSLSEDRVMDSNQFERERGALSWCGCAA